MATARPTRNDMFGAHGASILSRWSGSFRSRSWTGQYKAGRPNVGEIQNSDEGLWNCLRSKPCVCTLVTFFMLELLCIIVVGLVISLNPNAHGTLPWCLESTITPSSLDRSQTSCKCDTSVTNQQNIVTSTGKYNKYLTNICTRD